MARPLHKRVLRWGNSYGIRLTRADLEMLRLQVDDDVDVELEPCRPDVDWDALPDLGLAADASTAHDEILAQGHAEDEP